MATVGVVGGGPAGLSASLFTQKNDLETVVFDTDKTWMHQAHLLNYPGIGSMDGSAYMESLRRQVEMFGTDLHQDCEVTGIQDNGERYTLATEDEDYDVNYVVLATGTDRDLAEELGCDFQGDLVDVNLSMETSKDNVYATGAMVRDQEWQAVISAGDGAAAALDILSGEKGGDFHDFDTPEQAALQFGNSY